MKVRNFLSLISVEYFVELDYNFLEVALHNTSPDYFHQMNSSQFKINLNK